MTAYGVSAGINYKFGGMVANTLDAHRAVLYFQEKYGAETADKLIDCRLHDTYARDGLTLTDLDLALYSQYFENEKHPSSDETLLQATTYAGIPETEAKALIQDKDEALMDVKMAIREQAGNGIDSVPYIVIEGKRRDITLVGAKEVEEYEKALESIVKESK